MIMEYFGELVRLFNEMAPYLLLGFLFAGILRVVFPRKIITRYMGRITFRIKREGDHRTPGIHIWG